MQLIKNNNNKKIGLVLEYWRESQSLSRNAYPVSLTSNSADIFNGENSDEC